MWLADPHWCPRCSWLAPGEWCADGERLALVLWCWVETSGSLHISGALDPAGSLGPLGALEANGLAPTFWCARMIGSLCERGCSHGQWLASGGWCPPQRWLALPGLVLSAIDGSLQLNGALAVTARSMSMVPSRLLARSRSLVRSMASARSGGMVRSYVRRLAREPWCAQF